MKRKQKLTKAEELLIELLYRVYQFRNCDGFREAGLDVCDPIWSNEIRNAALYLGERHWIFHFPEFGVEHGQDANRAGV